MSDPAENRNVRGNVIKPHETNPKVPVKQPYLSIAAVLNIVGSNLGTGLTFDQDKTLINATASSGINRLNTAETFGESNLTLSLNGTEVSDNSLQINTNYGTTADYGSYNDVKAPNTSKLGAFVNPNQNLEGIQVTAAPNSNVTFELKESDGNVLDSYDATGGETFTLLGSLSSGTDYIIAKDGSSEEIDRDNSFSQVTTSDIDIVAGAYKTSKDSNYIYGIDSVTALISAGVSGTATIEWPDDRDVYEWDKATYLENPDGETVEVYVAYNGGNGWTRSNGGNPISRGYDLSSDSNIDPSDNVRLEVELSRSDTANNPRLESAYLSWQV